MKRFTPIERFAHRTITILMFILIATAAALYIPDISVVVGNRGIVKTIHSVSGFLLPIPLIIAIAFPVFRMNMRELNRFHPHDFAWLKRQDSSSIKPELVNPDPVYGKYNAGQKFNSAFIFGSILIMFATGMVMFFSSLFTDDIRTGATFVHDWLTLAIVVALAGHIYHAINDAQARMGMRSGEVTQSWAQAHHPQWVWAQTQSKEPRKPDEMDKNLLRVSRLRPTFPGTGKVRRVLLAATEPEIHPVDENQGENHQER